MKTIKKIMAELLALSLLCSVAFTMPVFADEVVVVNEGNQTLGAAHMDGTQGSVELDASAMIEAQEIAQDVISAKTDYTEAVYDLGSWDSASLAGYTCDDRAVIHFQADDIGEGVLTLENDTNVNLSFEILDVFANVRATGNLEEGFWDYFTIGELEEGKVYALVVYVGDADKTVSQLSGGISYRITPRDLSKYSCLVDDKVYNGSRTISSSSNILYYKDKYSALEQGDAYSVIASTAAVGPAKVTFSALEPFTGTKVKGAYNKSTNPNGFAIFPKSTTLKSLTKGTKSFTAKWYKKTVQTTGYQIRYSTNKSMSGAKIVTISKNGTTSKTIKKLKAKKKYYVQVRTYKKVGTVMYVSTWSPKKYVTTK